jgi:RNA polymerase sigma-70 factor, ECF subfamily
MRRRLKSDAAELPRANWRNPVTAFMSAGRRHHNPPLTLVGAPAAGQPTPGDVYRANGSLNWSLLMTRAQGGDRQAYRALLEDMAPYLRSIAARCFKEANDVEDAVQDVLMTVHAIRHAYDPGRPFGPWLLAIANRRIIDRLRRQTRAKVREIALTAEHETFSQVQANVPPHIEGSLNEAALHQAIENLPPDQRQAIRLLKLEEMSLKEASAKSGRSVAALKVAAHRAIANLRKLLRPSSEP